MAFQLEGATQKIEAIRGIANVIRYWPRVGGKLAVASNPSLLELKSIGSVDVVAVLPIVSVAGDGSLQFTLTPPAGALLLEDYHFDIRYTANGELQTDRVYFDVCRVPLTCPIDQNLLEAQDPSIAKYLTAGGLSDAARFVLGGWDRVVGKIRGAGFRPALATDRHQFIRAGVHAAMAEIYDWLSRKKDDVWELKADKAEARFEKAWNDLGVIKFEDEQQSGAPLDGVALAQKGFRI